MNTSIQDAASQLMPPEGLAEMIGVRKSTLATWRHKQLGPSYVKLGKKIFYRRADVELWIAAQAVHPEVVESDIKLLRDVAPGREGDEQLRLFVHGETA